MQGGGGNNSSEKFILQKFIAPSADNGGYL